jgi:ferredoxin--NADP+ reductase
MWTPPVLAPKAVLERSTRMSSQTQENASPEPLPFNLYPEHRPARARVLDNRRLTAPDADEIRHITLLIEGLNYRYREGQCLGLLIPGVDERGHSSKLRLFSIASSRMGDDGRGETLSICVKRARFIDPATGLERSNPTSSYVCDLQPGDHVALTGPLGKSFLLPQDPASNLILAATGTGIAPFRAFLRHIYHERRDWTGQIRLFYGVKSAAACAYREELDAFAQNPNFQVHYAFSREMMDPEGHRIYVHHRMQEQIDELWRLLDLPSTYLYICGLKGMEERIDQVLERRAHQDHVSWRAFHRVLIESGRLLTETY